MAFSLETIDAAVLAYLRTTVFPGQTVHEQAVADDTLLERGPNGAVIPYVTYAMGDLQQWGSHSFTGPMGDDYVFPIHLKIVVPGDGVGVGKKLYANCISRMLGVGFAWAGEIKKRAGGLQFPIKKSDGSVEAIVFPVSFGLDIQLSMSA